MLDERQIAYWENRGFPRSVAVGQITWQRRRIIARLRGQGMSYAAIGRLMQITGARVGDIYWSWNRRKNETSPVLRHLTQWGELHDLTQSPHTMQMIGWMAGGPKPTIKLRHRVRAKQRPPFNPTAADIASIWDAFKDTDQP